MQPEKGKEAQGKEGYKGQRQYKGGYKGKEREKITVATKVKMHRGKIDTEQTTKEETKNRTRHGGKEKTPTPTPIPRTPL